MAGLLLESSSASPASPEKKSPPSLVFWTPWACHCSSAIARREVLRPLIESSPSLLTSIGREEVLLLPVESTVVLPELAASGDPVDV